MVSSHFKHRDRTESPETGSLVPPSAPRPHEIPGNQQSRPSSGTETTRFPRKPTVSSLFGHRDHSDSPETNSLVPLQAPRPHRIPRNLQSRPFFGTETTRISPKSAVSSLFKHRDHSESLEADSLVPPSAPRPRGFVRKPAVSSLLRHRDHTESP